MKRRLKNWLLSFGEWSLPRSEAPMTYHFWAGLFTLSSALRRRAYIPKNILGGWSCYPHLYIIFVAPPGQARKSTTAGYSEELLHEIKTINKAPTAVTVERMIKMLEESHDASLSIFSSEFASFIQKSGFAMYDLLTDLFDAKKHIEVQTISRKVDFAANPCINLLACTTPEWISENMPEHVIGGGFSSRVIFVFEEKTRRHQLYYEGLDYKYLEKLKAELVLDLMHISMNIKGEFKLEEDAKSFMEQWYDKMQTGLESNSALNHRLAGYYQRKPAHVHKLAMLLHAAHSDDLYLTLEDFKQAITILEQVEKKLPKTFKNIGKNPYTTELERIAEYIRERKRVPRMELLEKFTYVAAPAILIDLLGFLIASGKVSIKDDVYEYIYPKA